VDPACDHAGVGPIRATPSKTDHAAPVGLEGLRAGAAALRARGIAPVAIGGLTLADAGACFEAGAESLSMIGEIQRSEEPRELLWQVQAQRWAARPILSRGRGVAIIGGSGAGKSSLAGALAQALGLPARDVDWTIGVDIRAIFREQGEAAFRTLEAASVAHCVEEPCVVALGGGAWETAATRDRIREAGFSVLWLAEIPEVAWARVGGDPDRPLASERDGFMARYARRSIAWQEAPMVLPLGRTAQELAEALVKKLN
jgi:shikimate kinase